MTKVASLDAGTLQAVLEVARAGSPSGAASKGDMQPSTLYRRIDAAERKVGAPLFFRHQGMWKPTALGNNLVEIAAELENRLRDFALAAAAHNVRAEGVLRVTTSDAFAHFYLASRLCNFHREHPGLRVELLTTNLRLDLTKGEADIALRPHSQPGDGLIGRCLGRMFHAVYGSKKYGGVRPLPRSADDLKGHHIIAYGTELSHFSAAQFTNDLLKGDAAIASFNTVTGLARAVESGLGLAALPCFVGDQLPNTQKLFPVDNGLPADIWLLCHEKQRRTKKARAFLSHFAAAIKADAPLFEGRD